MLNIGLFLSVSFCAFLFSIVEKPVHSVLVLVLTFFVSSLALRSAGFEFLALLFMVVYMGAIAVLFLFVVMMLDLKANTVRMNPNFTLLLTIACGAGLWLDFEDFHAGGTQSFVNSMQSVTTVESMGRVLYTHYYPLYLVAGFVLLVALIGAVVLAVPRNTLEVKQDLAVQLARNPSDAVFTVRKMK